MSKAGTGTACMHRTEGNGTPSAAHTAGAPEASRPPAVPDPVTLQYRVVNAMSHAGE